MDEVDEPAGDPVMSPEGSPIAVRAATVRHVVRRLASAHPRIYLPVARRKYPHATLNRDTALVIDGFTRSAVTFAVVAFQLAQNDHVRVSHHLHAAGHLIEAARRGVPTLVTVREPADTVLSALIREPLVPPAQFLRSFADFYERILPYRSRFVVATFEEVTSDMGQVTGRVNERYGTRFRCFEQTDENVEMCFSLIEERSRRPPWEGLLGLFLSGRMSADEYRAATEEVRRTSELRSIPEHRVQRPSEERRALKESLRSRYEAPELAGLRSRTDRAFARFTRGSERGDRPEPGAPQG